MAININNMTFTCKFLVFVVAVNVVLVVGFVCFIFFDVVVVVFILDRSRDSLEMTSRWPRSIRLRELGRVRLEEVPGPIALIGRILRQQPVHLRLVFGHIRILTEFGLR